MPNLAHETARLENILNRMHAEGRETCVHREKTTFDSMTAPFPDIVLFGAGVLGRSVLEGLRKTGVNPLAFADNNRNLWGSRVDGLAVLPPGSCRALPG